MCNILQDREGGVYRSGCHSYQIGFPRGLAKFIIIFTPIQYASIALKTTAKHILKFAF